MYLFRVSKQDGMLVLVVTLCLKYKGKCNEALCRKWKRVEKCGAVKMGIEDHYFKEMCSFVV